jgi:hypothetical protein
MRMRRPAFIVALLLPLPFAALPLFSLLFTPAAQSPAPLEAVTVQPADTRSDVEPMAYGVGQGHLHRDCGSSTSAIEG